MKYIIVDIDGTVANCQHRIPLIRKEKGFKKDYKQFYNLVYQDSPIQPIIDLVDILSLTHNIIFVSGRSSQCQKMTEEWIFKYLNLHRSDYLIFMRKEGDYRSDDIIKSELLEEIQNEGISLSDIKYVLDDRDRVVKMWREKGLVCLQVANGDF